MEEKELIEKSSSSFARFASWVAVQPGEHWKLNEGREDGPTQGRGRPLLPSALSCWFPSILKQKYTKSDLNPLAYRNVFRASTKKKTVLHIKSLQNAIHSQDFWAPPLLILTHTDAVSRRSLHGRLNIKHGTHRRKPWGYHVQLLSHAYIRAEAPYAG